MTEHTASEAVAMKAAVTAMVPHIYLGRVDLAARDGISAYLAALEARPAPAPDEVERVALQILLAREGLDCDLAMVSEYERHLARAAIAALRPAMPEVPRFFIEHGQIHDRHTGKHVTTDEDSVFCDGINSALALLNRLDADARAAPAPAPATEGEVERGGGTAKEEQAVMVCPDCLGEGGYADGLDDDAIHTPCARCDGNCWIVDCAALSAARPSREGEMRAALEPFALSGERDWDDDAPDATELWCCQGPGYYPNRSVLTVGDLRRARAALQQQKEG